LKLGSSWANIPPSVFVQDLVNSSIQTEEETEAAPSDQIVACITNHEEDWQAPFIVYLLEAKIPEDKIEMERLVCHSKHYVLVDGKLMRKNAKSEVLQKCVTREEGIKILQEVHGGMCGNHAASCTLVGKAFRAGFYCPTAVKDAETIVWHCEACQFFTNQIHV
jgi:hypothetical protein